MNLSVVGENLTGIVTACCLAELGNQVLLFTETEYSERLILENIVEEPLLNRLFDKVIKNGFLALSSEYSSFPEHAGMVFVALEDEYEIESLLERFISSKKNIPPLLLILQCTHSVGFAKKLQSLISKNNSDIVLVNFPSFIKEGNALNDFRRPDRMIIGYENNSTDRPLESIQPVIEVLQPFSLHQDLFVFMSLTEAEFTRLAVNSLLATRLSLMNEMANVAEQLDVDISAVRKGIGTDARIGPHYLYPGCGYGGENIDKHIQEFAQLVEEVGGDARLLEAAIESNNNQKEVLFRKLWKIFHADIQGKTFAFWGVAFKPGTRSVSKAPSLVMAKALLSQGARLKVYDPMANDNFLESMKHMGQLDHSAITLCDTAMDAVQQSDALIILTEWKEFYSPDFDQLVDRLNHPVILDGKNLYEPDKMKQLNIDYYGIGRGVSI